MKTIGVVTVARSDYGIYLPILRAIQADPELSLVLYVGGMHLSPEFGSTVRAIEADGFTIASRVEMLLSSDTPEGIAKSTGLGLMGFAQAYAAKRPDLLLVLGDRFEMMAAALAALPFKIPLGHIHGGEVTLGAMDEALRHSITKLSHLHFVATAEYARRVAQLGEEARRIWVCGAPSLDNVNHITLLSADELEQRFGIPQNPRPLLVTFHPVTLEYERTEEQTGELLAALEGVAQPIVFTMPNADTGSRSVIQMIQRFIDDHPSARRVDNLGTRAYFSLMAVASAMVGNSSSGIIEAASFRLPVVNIGSRQEGRARSANVIDVGNQRQAIAEGIRKATSTEFRNSLDGLVNAYGDGHAAERILAVLKDVELDDSLLLKRFVDTVLPH